MIIASTKYVVGCWAKCSNTRITDRQNVKFYLQWEYNFPFITKIWFSNMKKKTFKNTNNFSSIFSQRQYGWFESQSHILMRLWLSYFTPLHLSSFIKMDIEKETNSGSWWRSNRVFISLYHSQHSNGYYILLPTVNVYWGLNLYEEALI